MSQDWSYLIDIAYLSLFLGISAILRRAFKPLSRLLIPNSVIAGFIGLALGPGGLGIIDLSFERLGNLVYHLMAIGFIAVTLKQMGKSTTRSAVNSGFYIAMSFSIQGFIGLLLGLVLAGTFKDLFPPFGLLLGLGFENGPGQAYSMGSQWESLGFTNGGVFGLTVATAGFIWAAIGGIILLNVLVYSKKQRGLSIEKPEIKKHVQATVKDYQFSDIDGFTIQIVAISIVYLATYLFLKWISSVLSPLGSYGETFAQVFWGIHFVIGVVFAFLFREIYQVVKAKTGSTTEYLNDFILQRIAGGAFDYMVVASIAGISLQVVREHLLPLIILTTVGGFLTMGYTVWFCKRIYRTAVVEHIVGFFGMSTGTISTGMALLREVDPKFETGTAEDMVIGSGVALFTSMPLIAIINIPILGYQLGKPVYYVYALLAMLMYVLGLFIFWFRHAKIRGKETEKPGVVTVSKLPQDG